MAEAHVVYQSVFEGLLHRAVGSRMTPALKAKLKALGVDLDADLKAVYPKEIWQGVVEACCSELYPRMDKAEALFKLGTEMVDGYSATLFGKAQMQMAKLLGSRRSIERAGQSFRAGNNFTELRMTAKGPTEYELWMNEVSQSGPFVRGSLVALLKVTGAKDIVVDVTPDVPPAATFHIRWSE
jgi:uncharacterized protein (TIGR02265 family)